jgi:polypeptide N-acetylgalactosaminyltransferase
MKNIFQNHVKDGIDYTSRNFKRVAEVWLGKYKEVMYIADPEKAEIDPGDLTKMKMIRDKLQCKPFDYFLEEIAPEMFTRYFFNGRYPGYFAHGLVTSEEIKDFCLERSDNNQIILAKCQSYLDHKKNKSQFFFLNWHRNLRMRTENYGCVQDNLYTGRCKYDGSSYQLWKYDLNTKQLSNKNRDGKCLQASNHTIILENCDSKNKNQKWNFTYINEIALKNYDKIYFKDNHFYGMDLTS